MKTDDSDAGVPAPESLPVALLPERKANPHLTLEQFAARAGVSPRTLQLHMQKGNISPFISNGGLGRGKRAYFSEAQLADFARLQGKRGLPPGAAPKAPPLPMATLPMERFSLYSPLAAQAGFQALRDGKKRIDLVLELGIHPDAATAMHREYHQLLAGDYGGIFVSAGTLRTIEMLPLALPDSGRITTEEELLQIIHVASGESSCRACKKKTGTRCETCYATAISREKQAARANVERVAAHFTKLHEANEAARVAGLGVDRGVETRVAQSETAGAAASAEIRSSPDEG